MPFVNVCQKNYKPELFSFLSSCCLYQICELCQLGQVDRVVYQKYELYLYKMDQDLYHVQGLYLELMLKMVTNVLKICSVPAKKIELSLQKLLLSLQKPLCPAQIILCT